MKIAFSLEQMRTADAQTIASGTPSYTLMRRAGKALADVVRGAADRLGVRDMLLVCGGGNNGGDGFVAAQFLMEMGYEPNVLCLAKTFSSDCQRAKEDYRGVAFARPIRRRYSLIVDCVFGTGLNRAIEGENKDMVELIVNSGAYVISADIPSGLAENGVAFSPCVKADETVCIGLLKSCLLLSDGVDHAGKITVVEIGISPVEGGMEVWEEKDIASYFPKKQSNVNKGNFGSASILGGNSVYSGACFLSAQACLKSGVGYTRLCVKEPVFTQAIGKLPCCILHCWKGLDEEILRSDCIAFGMGAGVSEETYALVKELLERYEGTLLLDADALNSLSLYGVDILKDKRCKTVMTPHPKEFSRLVGKGVEEVLKNAVEYAKAFAKEYGVIVALKNNRTVITDGVRSAINPTGSPVLSKGGSGDILSGFLAGTVARGVPVYEATCLSCYCLGYASSLVAQDLGEYYPDGEDIISYLYKSMKN